MEKIVCLSLSFRAMVAILSSFFAMGKPECWCLLVHTAGMAFLAEMDGSLLSSQSLRLSCLLSMM